MKYINKYNKIKIKIIRRYENKKYKNIQKSIMLRGNLAIQNPNYVKKLQLKQLF